MQDLVGREFSTFGTVTTFSWLPVDHRGLGREMREGVLHLAFEGLGAKEARSDAFVEIHGSNTNLAKPRARAERVRVGDAAAQAWPVEPAAAEQGHLGAAPQR